MSSFPLGLLSTLWSLDPECAGIPKPPLLLPKTFAGSPNQDDADQFPVVVAAQNVCRHPKFE
jgi:hypothetical protein